MHNILGYALSCRRECSCQDLRRNSTTVSRHLKKKTDGSLERPHTSSSNIDTCSSAVEHSYWNNTAALRRDRSCRQFQRTCRFATRSKNTSRQAPYQSSLLHVSKFPDRPRQPA